MSETSTADNYVVQSRKYIEQQTCDHIIGTWEGVEEGGLVNVSDKSHYPDHMINQLFNYCPTCGARLETV